MLEISEDAYIWYVMHKHNNTFARWATRDCHVSNTTKVKASRKFLFLQYFTSQVNTRPLFSFGNKSVVNVLFLTVESHFNATSIIRQPQLNNNFSKYQNVELSKTLAQ